MEVIKWFNTYNIVMLIIIVPMLLDVYTTGKLLAVHPDIISLESNPLKSDNYGILFILCLNIVFILCYWFLLYHNRFNVRRCPDCILVLVFMSFFLVPPRIVAVNNAVEISTLSSGEVNEMISYAETEVGKVEVSRAYKNLINDRLVSPLLYSVLSWIVFRISYTVIPKSPKSTLADGMIGK